MKTSNVSNVNKPTVLCDSSWTFTQQTEGKLLKCLVKNSRRWTSAGTLGAVWLKSVTIATAAEDGDEREQSCSQSWAVVKQLTGQNLSKLLNWLAVAAILISVTSIRNYDGVKGHFTDERTRGVHFWQKKKPLKFEIHFRNFQQTENSDFKSDKFLR